MGLLTGLSIQFYYLSENGTPYAMGLLIELGVLYNLFEE